MNRPSREAVLSAMAEFDTLGRAAFLEKYGFADRNITYQVDYEGRRYPSKAIFGSAFGHASGGVARDSSNCNGTEAREHLAKLGFTIVGSGEESDPVGPAQSNAPLIDQHALERLRLLFLEK